MPKSTRQLRVVALIETTCTDIGLGHVRKYLLNDLAEYGRITAIETITDDLPPIERWESLKARILAEIKEIDDATTGGEREPQWWLEMMAVAREVRK